MTEEEQNTNNRKEQPARKAKTGAWWKSVKPAGTSGGNEATAPEQAPVPAPPAR